jgi:DNA-binding transcriptional LysR family regulator
MFESAARHLSFAAAAEELGVTRSAVGHSVTALEAWLGVPLFARTGRGLFLTDAGKRYYPVIARCLTQLTAAVDAVPGRPVSGQLRITVSPTFAARLLVPRMAQLQRQLPGLTIHLDTTHDLSELPRDGLDVAIRIGTGDWPDLQAFCLVREMLQPLASPALAAAMREKTSLDDVPAIIVSTVSHDWEAYIERVGLAAPIRRVLTVDRLDLAMRAAVEGLGVIIGHSPLCHREIESGTLVPLAWPAIQSGVAYWLAGRPESFMRPEISAFRDWALETFSEAGPDALSA